MSLFSWLLMGHLVGDWLLQNDWMATGKKQAFITRSGLTHFTIYTLVIMLTLMLTNSSDRDPFRLGLLTIIIFISHWIIDATDIVGRWIRFYKQSDITLIRIMVDQTFHLIILAVVVSAIS